MADGTLAESTAGASWEAGTLLHFLHFLHFLHLCTSDIFFYPATVPVQEKWALWQSAQNAIMGEAGADLRSMVSECMRHVTDTERATHFYDMLFAADLAEIHALVLEAFFGCLLTLRSSPLFNCRTVRGRTSSSHTLPMKMLCLRRCFAKLGTLVESVPSLELWVQF